MGTESHSLRKKPPSSQYGNKPTAHTLRTLQSLPHGWAGKTATVIAQEKASRIWSRQTTGLVQPGPGAVPENLGNKLAIIHESGEGLASSRRAPLCAAEKSCCPQRARQQYPRPAMPTQV